MDVYLSCWRLAAWGLNYGDGMRCPIDRVVVDLDATDAAVTVRDGYLGIVIVRPAAPNAIAG